MEVGQLTDHLLRQVSAAPVLATEQPVIALNTDASLLDIVEFLRTSERTDKVQIFKQLFSAITLAHLLDTLLEAIDKDSLAQSEKPFVPGQNTQENTGDPTENHDGSNDVVDSNGTSTRARLNPSTLLKELAKEIVTDDPIPESEPRVLTTFKENRAHEKSVTHQVPRFEQSASPQSGKPSFEQTIGELTRQLDLTSELLPLDELVPQEIDPALLAKTSTQVPVPTNGTPVPSPRDHISELLTRLITAVGASETPDIDWETILPIMTELLDEIALESAQGDPTTRQLLSTSRHGLEANSQENSSAVRSRQTRIESALAQRMELIRSGLPADSAKEILSRLVPQEATAASLTPSHAAAMAAAIPHLDPWIVARLVAALEPADRQMLIAIRKKLGKRNGRSRGSASGLAFLLAGLFGFRGDDTGPEDPPEQRSKFTR